MNRLEVPRFLVYAGMILVCLLLIPPAVIARVRSQPSPNRPIHIIQDMDVQARFDTQSVNPIFDDTRAMRPLLREVVARQDPVSRGHYSDGVIDGAWATTLPEEVPLSLELLHRGQGRFNIYCAPCHGYAGFGDGMINQRAMELMANALGPVRGTVWVQAKSLHEEQIEAQPIGQIYNTITHGIRNMAGYAAQIPIEDRWAIAAYVKTLQRSQNASPQDVPPDVRIPG